MGCDKCRVDGKNVNRTMTFPINVQNLRSDAIHRAGGENNQILDKGESPFCMFKSLNMIKDFNIVAMHAVYIGGRFKMNTSQGCPRRI